MYKTLHLYAQNAPKYCPCLCKGKHNIPIKQTPTNILPQKPNNPNKIAPLRAFFMSLPYLITARKKGGENSPLQKPRKTRLKCTFF